MKKQKSIIGIAVIVFFVGCIVAKAQNPSPTIVGKWLTSENDIIEFYKSGNRYYGKLLKTGSGTDTADPLNPCRALRSKPIAGKDIVLDLVYTGAKTWENGRIYLPSEGMVLECEVELLSNDKLELSIPLGLFSESETWKRLR